MNKILYPPLIIVGIIIPILVYTLINRSDENIAFAGVLTLLLLIVLWKSNDNFWMNRRLPVMCPNNYKKVRVEVNSFYKTGEVFDDVNGFYFCYDAKNNKFTVAKLMYTKPSRHSIEYEERKKKIKARMKQLEIPIDSLSIKSRDVSCFQTIVILKKKDATPDNIKLVRETLVDLAKDDWVIEAQPMVYPAFESFAMADMESIVNEKDVCVAFYEYYGDHLYYIHYVDDKAKEIFVENAESHEIVSLDYDELDEYYQQLEGLSEMLDSLEVAYVGTISMEDFKSFLTQ